MTSTGIFICAWSCNEGVLPLRCAQLSARPESTLRQKRLWPAAAPVDVNSGARFRVDGYEGGIRCTRLCSAGHVQTGSDKTLERRASSVWKMLDSGQQGC